VAAQNRWHGANLKRMLDLVSKRRPTLALFPEMWLTGYSVRDA